MADPGGGRQLGGHGTRRLEAGHSSVLVARVATGTAALGAAALLYRVDPQTTRVPLCPLHALTNLWCPFCGSTRAAHEWLHGNVGTALADNALVVVLLPLVLMVLLRRSSHSVPWPSGRHALLLRWGLAAGVLAFTIARNLPAFHWLAPQR